MAYATISSATVTESRVLFTISLSSVQTGVLDTYRRFPGKEVAAVSSPLYSVVAGRRAIRQRL